MPASQHIFERDFFTRGLHRRPLRVWRLDRPWERPTPHHTIPDTKGERGALVPGSRWEDMVDDDDDEASAAPPPRTTKRGAVALLGAGCGELRCAYLRDLAPKAPPPKGAKPLLAEVLPLPAKASGETSRSRLRSVSHVHSCDGARVAAVHLDDGHVALLRNDDGAATLVPWLTPQGDGISLRVSVAHVTSGERPLLADSVLTDRKKFSDVAVVLAVFDANRDAGVLKVGRLASFDANDLRVGDGDLVVSDDVGVCDPAKVRSGGRCWACGDCATHWEESARDALRPSYREAERKRKPEDDEVQLIEAPAEKPAAADGPPAKKKTKQAAPASLRSEVRSLRDALAERTAAHEEDLRRADRRFGEEKKLRKAWNAQRADYEARLAAHAQESASAVRAVSGGDDAMDAADLSKVHDALVEALAKNRALTAARAAADALEEERKKQASTCVVCAEAESRVALAPCGHMCLCPTDAAQLHAKGMLRKCPVCKQPVTATVVVREV